MLFEDTYKTISSKSEGMFKDKGSKFIGYAYPVGSESEVKVILIKLKSEHSKARHFCWALRLSQDRSVFRINDDGEPSGTAGRPILNCLLSSELTNILVVVVRYFGGVLLGVPRLINAYKTATIEALKAAEKIDRTINELYRISFNYIKVNEVMKTVKDAQIQVISQVFKENCIMDLEIRQSKLNDILTMLKSIDTLKTEYIKTV